MLAGLGTSQAVTAADTIVVDGPAIASNTAQVEVTGQSLALLQVPDLRFEAVNVEALIQGAKTLSLASGVVTKDGAGPGFDGDDQKQIVVSDLRGTNSGWQLLVKLDAFQLADTQTALMPTSATFAPSPATGVNVAGIALKPLNFADTDAPVVVAPAGRGTGVTTVAITSASVTLPQTKNALAGDYRAPLNWLLVSGPLP